MSRRWFDQHTATLASTVGGGELSPGVTSIVASAALALAGSRWAYDLGLSSGDAKLVALGAKLADQSRHSLLTAHELAAREAKARPRPATNYPWLVQPDAGADDAPNDVEGTNSTPKRTRARRAPMRGRNR